MTDLYKQIKLKDSQEINSIGKLDSESKGSYSHHNPITFLTKSIDSSLCDYSDTYILVTGNITVTRTIAGAGGNPTQRNQLLAAATQVAFKNCPPFENC